MLVVTNSYLIGVNAHSREEAASKVFQSSEVIDLRKESATNTLLNQHNPLLHFKLHPLHTDKCNYHPLSKKLLFIANGDHH